LTIISYTPQLYHLNYTNTKSNDRNIEINSSIKLSNLKYLSIRVYSAKFHIFEMFLRKIDSKLKVLSFTTRHEGIIYLYANRWKEIILKYLFQLKEFYLQYYASFTSSHDRFRPCLRVSSGGLFIFILTRRL